MTFDLSSYVEVADRIREWYERFPEGRITTTVEEWVDDRVMVRAEAYRGLRRPELEFDPPAGTGHSYLAIPGKTPYTAGAELENAETSAVGRALVMAGLSSKTVASADEVRAKHKPKAKAAPKDWGAQSQQAPHNEGVAVEVEGKDARAEKSEPVGGGKLGEGASPPAGEDMFEADLQRAVALCGNLAKVVLWCKTNHPDWEIRTHSDLLGWHVLRLIEEASP